MSNSILTTDNTNARSLLQPVILGNSGVVETSTNNAMGLGRYKEMGKEMALKDPRCGGMSLEDLRSIATSLSLPFSGIKKDVLVSSIEVHLINTARLESMGSSFRRCKNSFARICNILFCNYLQELLQSQTAATRMQLEYRAVGDEHQIWYSVAADFKNSSLKFGSIAPDDSIFIKEGIDPDSVNFSMEVTNKNMAETFNSTIKQYDKFRANWERSGQHAGLSFWQFCTNCDQLYLFYWLEKLNNQDLTRFVRESSKVLTVGGLNTVSTQEMSPESELSTVSNCLPAGENERSRSQTGRKRGVEDKREFVKNLRRRTDIAEMSQVELCKTEQMLRKKIQMEILFKLEEKLENYKRNNEPIPAWFKSAYDMAICDMNRTVFGSITSDTLPHTPIEAASFIGGMRTNDALEGTNTYPLDDEFI